MMPVVFCAALLAQVPDLGRPVSSPRYVEHLLTSADLEGRSPEELALMRNTIYAHAGRTFKNPKLREYFAAQPWYGQEPEPRLPIPVRAELAAALAGQRRPAPSPGRA
jgi:hypothetical protein